MSIDTREALSPPEEVAGSPELAAAAPASTIRPGTSGSAAPMDARVRPAWGSGHARVPVAGWAVVSGAVGRLVQLVWLSVACLDLILLLDFVFRIIRAQDSGFAHAIYLVGSTVAGPFAGIFANVARPAGVNFAWDDLLAVVVYTIAGLILTSLIGSLGPRRRRIV